MKKECLAIIPARGGSKRIPKKNIKEFCGKPIIAYSIEAAIQSNIFDEVMVSTDSEDIKLVSEKFGGIVPFMRSETTSNDMAMTHEVILEVLAEYKKRDIEFEHVCCIYPTAPFLSGETLQNAKKLLDENGANGAVPVVAYAFPPQRCFIIDNGRVFYKYPENRLVRSQDLERLYHDCGQFYFLRTNAFLKQKSLVMDNTIPILIDEMDAQDIDTLEDWRLAEVKYTMKNRH